jgi:hypothetical protein
MFLFYVFFAFSAVKYSVPLQYQNRGILLLLPPGWGGCYWFSVSPRQNIQLDNIGNVEGWEGEIFLGVGFSRQVSGFEQFCEKW